MARLNSRYPAVAGNHADRVDRIGEVERNRFGRAQGPGSQFLIAGGGIAFSSERAGTAVRSSHGIDNLESLVGPAPAIYRSKPRTRAGMVLRSYTLAMFRGFCASTM